MDRKPRAWLLFVLSAGVVFFAFKYAQSEKQLNDCKDERVADSQRSNDMYSDLFQAFLNLKQQQQKQADSVQTLKEKAKSVIREVKKKL
jgi:hypothetical protein